jgi:hypothetical protein
MKIKPAKVYVPGKHVSRHTGRPKWLGEWLENQGKYVELECGHLVDLNDRSYAPLVHPTEQMIDCEIHRSWQRIVKRISFLEFAGIKVKPTPDEPLF